jgi:hypothetical protein
LSGVFGFLIGGASIFGAAVAFSERAIAISASAP